MPHFVFYSKLQKLFFFVGSGWVPFSRIAAVVPAMSAQFFLGQSDSSHQVVEPLEYKRGKVQLFTDHIHHGGILFGFGIAVQGNIFNCFSFEFPDGLPCGQFRYIFDLEKLRNSQE
jgi:hypothetical protein